MARLVGTGKDPRGQFGKDEVFDIPRNDPQFQEVIDAGYAKEQDPKDDPGRTVEQIAHSKIQGHPLADPAEQKISSEIKDIDAYKITHTGDRNLAKQIGDDLRPEGAADGSDDPKQLDEATSASVARGRVQAEVAEGQEKAAAKK